MDQYAILYSEIDDWPSKAVMADLLLRSGFDITVGTYSIRMNDFSHFVFREFGGDLGLPCITADDESLDALLEFSARVSEALGKNNVRHRFEIYDASERLAGYFHHDWPQEIDV